jgi:hypothetical protein
MCLARAEEGAVGQGKLSFLNQFFGRQLLGQFEQVSQHDAIFNGIGAG